MSTKPRLPAKTVRMARTQALKRKAALLARQPLNALERLADSPLNPHQERFVAEYLLDHNATQAYMIAYPGCSRTSAGTAGTRLLLNVRVAAQVARHLQEQLTALEFNASEVLRNIRDGCRFDVRRLFDEQGRPRPFDELTFEEAGMIESYEISLKDATAGDGIDRVLKVKLTPRVKYLELAAIHFQLLLQQINQSGGLAVVDEHSSDEELIAEIEQIATGRGRGWGCRRSSRSYHYSGSSDTLQTEHRIISRSRHAPAVQR
jgi:phage terminase small subunit